VKVAAAGSTPPNAPPGSTAVRPVRRVQVDDRPETYSSGSLLVRAFGPAWPLKLLLLGFPLWWALGFASFAFLIAAGAMAAQLVTRRSIHVPRGFGIWVLFLAWMLVGGFVLWAQAPGTVDGGGLERLVGFAYRAVWYLAVTVAMLYAMNLPDRQVPSIKVIRWMGFLFLTAVVGGIAGLLFPRFEFTSLAELIVPGADSAFIYAKVHPSLSTVSDFLGYEQARPKAPFTYANAWGNNVGLLLPFFAYAVMRAERTWLRVAGVLVLLAALVPIAYSLNRGLWLGLGLLFGYGTFLLVRQRRFTAVWVAVAVLTAATVVVGISPIGQTVTLRLETPHSNDRRTEVADVVVRTTLQGSPLVGYGTNRQVLGSFASLAGGGSADCRQCAAPPLGTQGFVWRLVLTTGFVGTALFGLFMLIQLLAHVRLRDPVSVLGCMTIMVSGLFFFVYDSLESPLFMLMLAIGLMNRRNIGVTVTTLHAQSQVETQPTLSRGTR